MFLGKLDTWHVQWDVLLIQEGLLGGASEDFSNGQSRFAIGGHSVMFAPGADGVHGVCIIIHSRHRIHIGEPVVHNEFLITIHLYWKTKRFLLASAYFRQSAFGLAVFETQLQSLQQALRSEMAAGDILLLGTDGNCNVGSATCANQNAALGIFGGTFRDARGEAMPRFCLRHKLCLMNTFTDIALPNWICVTRAEQWAAIR